MLPGKGRSHGLVNNSVPTPPHNSPSHSEPRHGEEARNQAFGGPTALPRGRLPGLPNVSTYSTGQAAFQVLSPRSQSSAATARSPLGPNGGLERRPSMTQGYHHNNRSHGGYQHARNASFVNSPTTSPLSPMTTPAEYVGMTMIHHGAPDGRVRESPSGTVKGSSPLSPSVASDKDSLNGTPTGSSQKRVDRAHTGKSRRGQSHQRTHSRQHHGEQKTVGEYALHHLFTSVCPSPSSGDRRLNHP